ncbi:MULTISPECIES: DUF3137 domain-containing protein [unclassified Paenibacillus]|uniref:DUF3137 domain-containing protein n=1 Tax=unclassified Paenibacillus TaxID=185978 RepID=UPI001C0F666D|nr:MULTISPECIES: DUF3137 domain-containing protein [unclassified Paenibacillus]MBU5441891.1 DUF3137 domain-containing protein [Paenibacillus sp. MSJ-34]CAH0122622.1 hypothetical protein PAE9249_05194 [Paenibacillus sp. CECT 9249]
MIPDYENFIQQLSGTKEWAELEKHRKKALLGRYLIAPLLCGGLFLFGVYFFNIGAVVVSVPFFIFMYRLAHKNYSKEYKKLIMPRLVTDMIKSFSNADAPGKTSVQCRYNQSKHVSEHLLFNIPLFGKYKADRIFLEGEDFFSGYLGSTDFQFSDLTFKHNRDIPFANQDINLTVYNGLVFIADFHKAFEGTTTLTTRTGKIYRRLTRIGSQMNSDSHEFDRIFRITTTDEITARYLLPANMQERMINLRKLFPRKGMAICLHEGMLVISIHNVDFFESDGLKKLDAGGMKRTYDEIKAIMDIIELLNLNLRIWNKRAKRRG